VAAAAGKLEYTADMSGHSRAHVLAPRILPAALLHSTLRALLHATLCATLLAGRAEAQPKPATAADSFSIPAGTILPIELRSTLSPEKSKPGQAISGRIMQDVPLPAGARIKAGSKVFGRVLAITPASAGVPPSISLQFDQLVLAGQTISIATDLRAIAGFVRIEEAQIPTTSGGEGEVYRWLPTSQIGGDVVYGADAPVGSAENADDIVGRSVHGGVLVQVRAKPGAACRGSIAGNPAPQALWVFSADACGVYGINHLVIAHAGRSAPAGVIVLASNAGKLKIPGGTGMLLRVNAPAEN
jgi:hypothetical protein